MYLSPNTLTPTFYVIYILAFVIPAVWIIAFQRTYIIVRRYFHFDHSSSFFFDILVDMDCLLSLIFIIIIGFVYYQ